MKVNPWKMSAVVLAAVSVVSTSAAIYYYRQYAGLKADPQSVAEAEVDRLVSAVSQLMVLPDERPTVATVTDPTQLKDQPFFKNAKVGDKVLIYTGANKAILYDPAADKILETAPLNVEAPANVPTPPTNAD